jgi:hypothetical protein
MIRRGPLAVWSCHHGTPLAQTQAKAQCGRDHAAVRKSVPRNLPAANS